MATIKGLKVFGREIEPGDVVMNEWSGKIMTVERVELVKDISVHLHCVMETGRHETLHGDWESVTRLITRQVPAYQPDEV